MPSDMVWKHVDGKSVQTFEGFGWVGGTANAYPEVMAMVHFDGGTSLWRLDPENIGLGVDELQRYYRTIHGRKVHVGIYGLYNIREKQ